MAELFSFEGVEFRPISKDLAKIRMLRTFLSLVVFTSIFTLLTVWVDAWFWIAVGVFAFLHLWRALLIYPQVKAFQYALLKNEILIKKGVFIKQMNAIPYGRIQYVEASQGPILRFFNLSEITIHTASSATEGTIPGLLEPDAATLRRYLSQRCESEMIGL